MRTIRLTGRLGKKFGPEHKLAIDSVGECVRAFCYLLPDFENEIVKGQYKIFVVRNGVERNIGEEEINFGLGKATEVIFKPVPKGNKKSGLGKIILGVALMGFAWFMGPSAAMLTVGAKTITYGSLGMIGGMMALNGVTAMLTPKTRATTPEDQKQSFIMDATGNLVEQGNPVPIVFGEVFTGSVVVSTGMSVDEVSTTGTDSDTPVSGADLPASATEGAWFGKTTPTEPLLGESDFANKYSFEDTNLFVYYSGAWYRYIAGIGNPGEFDNYRHPPVWHDTVPSSVLGDSKILHLSEKVMYIAIGLTYTKLDSIVTTLPVGVAGQTILYAFTQNGVNYITIAMYNGYKWIYL